MHIKRCPFCGEGELKRMTKDVSFEYRNHTTKIPQPGEFCDACDEGIVSGHDIKMTEKALHDWRANIDGYLTSDQVRRIRKKLGLTQREAAKIFGGGANAFSRYENGEVLHIRATDNLLRLLDNHPHLLEEIRDQAGETEAA